MKKFLLIIAAMLIVLCAALSFIACAGDNSGNGGNGEQTEQQGKDPSENPEQGNKPSGGETTPGGTTPGGTTPGEGETTPGEGEQGGGQGGETKPEEKKDCKVTFDSNGGSPVPSQTVEKGGKLAKPADPIHRILMFIGWYIDEDCTTKWDFETNIVTSDITLYAKMVVPTQDFEFEVVDNKYLKIKNYLGNDKEIYIAGEYGQFPVKEIGERAFSMCDFITSVTIGGNQLTTIGFHAFSKCEELKEVTIPDSVTEIADEAFLYCGKLKNVTIGKNSQLSSIGGSAFEGCTYLTNITLPKNLTSIGDEAFEGCNKLIEVVNLSKLNIEAGSENYGYVAKYAKKVIKSKSESKIKKSGEYRIYEEEEKALLLEYNGDETVPKLPDSFNDKDYEIYDYAFFNNNKITGVAFGENSRLIAIDTEAFGMCGELTEIAFPKNLSSIGDDAFYYCLKLKTISIPKSVTTISDTAFQYCSSITSIKVDSENTKYNNEGNCLIDTTTHTLIKGYKDSSIPSGVTEIGHHAFYNCTNLTEITVPDSVTSINNSAFNNCDNLTSVTFGKDSKLTSIGGGAFRSCSSLMMITIPKSVTTIGGGAFMYCSSLTEITISNNATEIGGGAFGGCRSLTAITIPFVGESRETTTNTHFGYIFGADSYRDNGKKVPTSLKTVVVTDTTTIGKSAFEGCNTLTTITIPFVGESRETTTYTHFGYIFGAESYRDNSKKVPTSLKTVVITDTTTIGDYAFSGCRLLTEITIPNKVTEIGNGAFYNCRGLTNITIPESVTTIGEFAFDYCSGLTSINVNIGNTVYKSEGNCLIEKATNKLILGCKNSKIPDSVTTIGNGAFSDCSSLTEITIPSGVTTIGESAFNGCDNLASITFGENSQLKTIGNHTFYGCSSLINITIPESVTTIGEWAFYNCISLISVTFENTKGWKAATSIKSKDLANPATAAEYLTKEYYFYAWTREVIDSN